MKNEAVGWESWTVSANRITAVVESETEGIPPQMFFQDATSADSIQPIFRAQTVFHLHLHCLGGKKLPETS